MNPPTATRSGTRHLASYLKLAEGARAGLAGAAQGAWLSRLDLERENLLAAHAWCDRAQGGGEMGLKLAYGVQPYWIKRGVLELGHRFMAEALARPGAEARNLDRCKALFGAGWLDCYMGRYEEAQRHLEESLAIAREIGDKRRVAAGLQPLAMAFLGQGDLGTARRHYRGGARPRAGAGEHASGRRGAQRIGADCTAWKGISTAPSRCTRRSWRSVAKCRTAR